MLHTPWWLGAAWKGGLLKEQSLIFWQCDHTVEQSGNQANHWVHGCDVRFVTLSSPLSEYDWTKGEVVQQNIILLKIKWKSYLCILLLSFFSREKPLLRQAFSYLHHVQKRNPPKLLGFQKCCLCAWIWTSIFNGLKGSIQQCSAIWNCYT